MSGWELSHGAVALDVAETKGYGRRADEGSDAQALGGVRSVRAAAREHVFVRDVREDTRGGLCEVSQSGFPRLGGVLQRR